MRKLQLLTLLLIAFQSTLIAQTGKKTPADKEDRKEALDERKAKNRDKVDNNLFRRQMLSLKEYADERKKISELQKLNKGVVKVLAYVDTLDADDGKNKSLIGYICEIVGDNATNIYEATYDRAQKKIINVRMTQEGAELEKEAAAAQPKGASKKVGKKSDDDDADEPKAAKKPATSKLAPKKKNDDDEEAEERTEKKPVVKKAPPKKKSDDDDDDEEEEKEKPVKKKQKDEDED